MKKTNFDTINKQFEKDDAKPCEGIRVILFVWILSFLIFNMITMGIEHASTETDNKSGI